MRPVSDAFLRAVRGSHRVVFQATAVDGFQDGVDPTGVDLPVLGGVVHMDGTADVRSTLDLVTVYDWPSVADLTLAPYGQELYVRSGIALSDDAVEWVGHGYFRIDSPHQDEAPDGPIVVVGSDRMAGLIDGRLLAARQFTSGTTFGAVVAELVGEIYPLAQIEWDDATNLATLTRDVIVEEDRYGFLDDAITSRGKIWYWDHRGYLVIESQPDPGRPVWHVHRGRDGVLVRAARSLTREGVYNAVVAAGEAMDEEAPARGVAYDDNPDSPTYFYGPFGKVPRFYFSPFLGSDAVARSAAASILRGQLGLPYRVRFKQSPNRALVPWDAVEIAHSDHHAPETHVLETIEIPLTEDEAMDTTTREQRVVLVGTT